MKLYLIKTSIVIFFKVKFNILRWVTILKVYLVSITMQMHELSNSYHSHGPGSITLINWSSLSQTKVSKTSAILEKAIPVILFQTKQKIQTTITKLPICREWHACLFVAAAGRVPELSWFTDTQQFHSMLIQAQRKITTTTTNPRLEEVFQLNIKCNGFVGVSSKTRYCKTGGHWV